MLFGQPGFFPFSSTSSMFLFFFLRIRRRVRFQFSAGKLIAPGQDKNITTAAAAKKKKEI